MTEGGKKESSWFVYILSCSDGTFYTGITTDIERRLGEHNAEKTGARYTRARRPVKLVYQETAESRSEAARREYRVRRLPADEKRALVARGPASEDN
jgi:putative endonuclease